MHSLPLSRVQVTDGFWSKWLDRVAAVTIPTQHEQLVKTGRLSNFEIAGKRGTGGYTGYRFNDSDVYKWVEACAYSLVHRPSKPNQELMDQVIGLIAAAQAEDGYLNTFVQVSEPQNKWRNLSMLHEMYCGGHLIEAAVAVTEAIGDRTLLNVAVAWVEHVMSIFGPEKRKGTCGHQEVELALIKLAKLTGEAKYRDFARWLVEIRGTRPSPFEAEYLDPELHAISPLGMKLLGTNGVYSGEYLQDHAPIREHDTVVGHAVRAMYFYMAATELAQDQSDQPLEDALLRGWKNLTERRMYVTGGIGPSGDNEGFTHDYDLPNHSAYAETCAAIGLALWGHRLNQATGDAAYVETVERALYNGALSGISLSGDRYFYANPLESRSDHERPDWYSCACCPPNIARFIGQVGSLALSEGKEGLWLNLPIGLKAETTFGAIEVSSSYPWTGKVTVTFVSPPSDAFAVRIRVPEWCDDCGMDLSGSEDAAEFEDGYAVYHRVWKAGDTLEIDFEMPPRWIQANPAVLENLGRVAVTCGPLVYCLEGPEFAVPQRFTADTDAELAVAWDRRLEGVNVVKVEGVAEDATFVDGLYAEIGELKLNPATVEFIPYYAWANRGRSHMQVWVRQG